MTPTDTLSRVALEPRMAAELAKAGQKAKDWTTQRDELIKIAHESGGGVREIARAVGLTHPAVLRILGKGTSDMPSKVSEEIVRILKERGVIE